MQIHGLNKTTLLDYPEHVAATIFTGGCNFRCPFCHNMNLVLNLADTPHVSEEEVLSFLKKRKSVLSGVCITGGEPTLQADLATFIDDIKEIGLLVKLDTNGYRPDVLRSLLGRNVLDYVAMDIKNTKEKYAMTTGMADLDISLIEESVHMIMESGIAYEFRTTVTRQLHEKEDFMKIGEWLCGAEKYYLQAYRDNENVLRRGFTSYSKQEMEQFATMMREQIKTVMVRGAD